MANKKVVKKNKKIFKKYERGIWENRFFAYNGSKDKVKIFKIVK